MSEQEITADQLDEVARRIRSVVPDGNKLVEDAARTIRRLEGEVAELSERYLTQGATIHGLIEADKQRAADAELGSLVRQWAKHPEREKGGDYLAAKNASVHYLTQRIAHLDAVATRRAAEEGERGLPAPSGARYRVSEGELEVLYRDTPHGWMAALAVETSDLDVVERVRKGVPRGE